MFANFTNFLVVLVVSLVVFHLLPRDQIRARQLVLIAASLFAVLVISIIAFSTAGVMFAATYAFVRYARGRQASTQDAWVATIGLLLVAITTKELIPGLSGVETIGISYVLLKLVSVVWMIKWRNYEPADIDARQLLLLTFFFPIYSAGPIERANAFGLKAFATPISADDILYGIYRVLLGVFFIHFLSNDLISNLTSQLGPVTGLSTGGTWLYIWLRFLALYLDFSGYSSIAIGSSRLFGLQIIENFRMPLISSSIREFWTRWHISLGRFVNTFLFMPMVKAMKGKAALPIFLAFVIVGVWHDTSWNYFIWGVGHGSMLAAYTIYDRACRQHDTWDRFRHASWTWRALSIVVTVSIISLLSVFANMPSLEAGLALVSRAFALS